MNHSKAAYFDSQVHSEWASKEYNENELRRIDRMLGLAGWTPNMRILEPGCGTGRLTALLAQRSGTNGSVLAVDISDKMVEEAQGRTSALPRVVVQSGHLEELALSPKEFDLVICHQVFPHFDDKRPALRKMADCLKPGGKLVVIHFINSEKINDMHRKTDPSVKTDSMPGPEEMTALFNEAGFSVDLLEDDDRGYLLMSTRSASHEETDGPFHG